MKKIYISLAFWIINLDVFVELNEQVVREEDLRSPEEQSIDHG
jgi:hypothetical protein